MNKTGKHPPYDRPTPRALYQARETPKPSSHGGYARGCTMLAAAAPLAAAILFVAWCIAAWITNMIGGR